MSPSDLSLSHSLSHPHFYAVFFPCHKRAFYFEFLHQIAIEPFTYMQAKVCPQIKRSHFENFI